MLLSFDYKDDVSMLLYDKYFWEKVHETKALILKKF